MIFTDTFNPRPSDQTNNQQKSIKDTCTFGKINFHHSPVKYYQAAEDSTLTSTTGLVAQANPRVKKGHLHFWEN